MVKSKVENNHMTVSDVRLINILIATYNGAKYLPEQLDSIYRQCHAHFSIIVRDDCSSDETIQILNKEAKRSNLVVLYGQRNLGPAKNFFTLLEKADPEADYFAFCDQDDIWLEDKLQRAVMKLAKADMGLPLLYCGPVIYATEACVPIRQSSIPNSIDFGNALIENVITGCTIVMNKSARNLIINNTPENCLMHDSWCYLVISCFGSILYDSQPKILYRQHSKNYFGVSDSLWGAVKKRIGRIYNRNELGFHRQAEEFLKLYKNDMAVDKLELIFNFVGAKYSLIQRLKLAFNRRIYRQHYLDDFLFRILVLFNRY